MQPNLYGETPSINDVFRERRRDVACINDLNANKLNGRVRTGFRAVPSSATNLIAGDAEGDFVTDATYTYTLITVSGTLKWNRIAHSTGW